LIAAILISLSLAWSAITTSASNPVVLGASPLVAIFFASTIRRSNRPGPTFAGKLL
jgi:hypothetical protein